MNSVQVLDLRPARAGPVLEKAVSGPRAWTRESVSADDWTIPVGPEALEEIDSMVRALRGDPLPTLLLEPGMFQLSACGKMMERVRRVLEDGIGLCVLDRLPLDAYPDEEAKAVYWVLGQMLGRTVAQKWDGTMLYDVTDTGAAYGHGVRGSWTNVELFFHTDNAFGPALPDFVSLLCLRPAKEGGISRFCSMYSLHNRLLEESPRLLRRLYEPFYFDRQAEHAPDSPPVSIAPIFSFDGERLHSRVSVKLAQRGYQLAGEALDPLGAEALAALDGVLADESLWVEFRIERGQMQYLNNTEFGHFRSTFTDDPGRKRHLVRMWYRARGRRTYEG